MSYLALKGINDSITSGNALIEDMKNVTLLLESRISILSDSISNLSYLCNGTVAAPQSAACAFLSSTDFAITVDYTNVSLGRTKNSKGLSFVVFS